MNTLYPSRLGSLTRTLSKPFFALAVAFLLFSPVIASAKADSEAFTDSVLAAVAANAISFNLPRIEHQQGAAAAQSKKTEMVELMEKSLADAKKVSDAFLDKLHPELKQFYRSSLMQGQASYIEGLRSKDQAMQASAARSMMAWGEFWGKNKDRIVAKLD